MQLDVRAPFVMAAAVTPNDTNALPIGQERTKAVYVGGTGAIAVRMAAGGNTVTFSGVPAGTLLPIAVDRILATGTTATLIVALA